MVVICTETAQSDYPKAQPTISQSSHSTIPQPYWKQYDQPQALQSRRVHAHRDEVDGQRPTGDDLDIAQNDESPPQPQRAAESRAQKEDEKKTEQPFGVDDPEPAKKETAVPRRQSKM